MPLVFAGKVHHSWLGGGVVTDGGLLEEAVELHGAGWGREGQLEVWVSRRGHGQTCEELVVLGGLDGAVCGKFAAAGEGGSVSE